MLNFYYLSIAGVVVSIKKVRFDELRTEYVLEYFLKETVAANYHYLRAPEITQRVEMIGGKSNG